MAVNKVIKDNTTLIDLTGDTAVASDVAQGKTFHLADGTIATGSAVPATDRLVPFLNNSLTTLDLTGVTRIDDYACYYKTALTSINAPDALAVGDHAFYACTALVTLNLPLATVVSYWSLCSCGFTSISLPSIEQVYPAAFNSCGNATRITLGSSLNRIRTYDDGNQAPFLACNSLEELVINATTPPTLQAARLFSNTDSGLGNMSNFRGIFVPDSENDEVLNLYKNSSNWSAYANYIFSQNDL